MARLEETAAHTHLEWDTPLFETAVAQFEPALPYADVSLVIARACERLGWNLAEQAYAVQGFGNVGGTAHELVDRWPTGTRITNEELLELPCDLLVLAARQERELTLRTAALVAGIREVAGSLDARGLYP